MMPAIRSEFRKLITLRSTVVVLLLLLAFLVFRSFYLEGFIVTGNTQETHKIASAVLDSAAPFSAAMVAITAVLLMAHEYRHNLINYSLTLSNSRTKFLLAKMLVVVGFAISVAVVTIMLSIGLTYLGVHLNGLHIVAQDLMLPSLMWRVTAYCICMSLLGLGITTLVRNLTASILILFIGLNLIEAPLTLLLKANSTYLPMTALGQIIIPHEAGQQAPPPQVMKTLTPVQALLVGLVYLAILWLVSWQLFLRRDAN